MKATGKAKEEVIPNPKDTVRNSPNWSRLPYLKIYLSL